MATNAPKLPSLQSATAALAAYEAQHPELQMNHPKGGGLNFAAAAGPQTSEEQENATQNQMGALGWLSDILSRPLYGVENVIHGAIHSGIEAGKETAQAAAKGDILGALGASFSHSFDNGGPVAAAAQGVFSTDPNQHHSTSDNIEYAADQVGRLADPNYVDTANNVNPIVKGIAGFAGDILLDPLTYVPGAQIAKLTKLGIDGVKGGMELAKGAVEGAKDIAKAKTAAKAVIEGAATTGMDAPAAKNAIVQAEKAGNAAGDVAAAETDAAKAVEPALEVPTTPKGKPVKPGKALPIDETPVTTPVVPASVGERLRQSDRAAHMASVLDALAPAGKDAAIHAVNTLTPKALQPTQYVAEKINLLEQAGDKASVADNTLTYRIPGERTPQKILYRDIPAALAKDAATSPQDVAGIQRAIASEYKTYSDAFEKAPVNALHEPVAATTTPTQSFANSLEAFRNLKATQSERVASIFGSKLMNQLSAMGPARFDQTVTRMSTILHTTEDLDELTSFGPRESAIRNMFSRLGIDPVAVNAERLQHLSNIGKSLTDKPGDLSDVLSKMADPKMGGKLNRAAQDVYDSFPSVLKKNVHLAQELYDKVSKSGAKQTAEGIGEGLGRYQYAFNTFMQWDAIRALTDKAVSEVPKTLYGPQRASQVFSRVLQSSKTLFGIADKLGMPVFLGTQDGEKVAMRFDQIIDSMVANGVGNKNLLQQVLFNGRNSIPTTQFLEAVRFAMQHDADVAQIDGVLKSVLKNNGKAGEIPNPFARDDAWLPYGTGGKPVVQGIDKVTSALDPFLDTQVPAWRWGKSSGTGFNREFSSGLLRHQLAAAIHSALPKLKSVEAANKAAFADRLLAETDDMVSDQITQLDALLSDPTRYADFVEGLADVDSSTSKIAKAGGALMTSTAAASEIIHAAAPEGAIEGAQTAKKLARAAKTGVGILDDGAKRVAQTQAELDAKLDEQAFQRAAEAEPPVDDSGAVTEWGQSAKEYRRINSIAARSFDRVRSLFDIRTYTDANLIEKMDNIGRGAYADWMRGVADDLNAMQKQFRGFMGNTQTTLLQQGFRDLQQGILDRPETSELVGQMQSIMSRIYGTGADSVFSNSAFRMGTSIDHLNRVLDWHGLPLIEEADSLEAMANQWKTWNIEDPLQFMMSTNAAMTRIAANHGVGRSWLALAKANGWVSSTAKAGFARLGGSGFSIIADSLPKNLYYDTEMLGHLRQVDDILNASSHIGGKFGEFIDKYLDPLTQGWKRGVTIWHVGHHIRNLVGDASATWVAEGTRGFAASQRTAVKVLAAHDTYEGVDMLGALEGDGVKELPHIGDALFEATGKLGKLTISDVYAAAKRLGLLRGVNVIESLEADKNVGSFGRVIDKLTLQGTKAEHLVMGVSEYREHFSRMQHFLQIIHNAYDGKGSISKVGSVEDLLEQAAKRVKRFHPDRSMLTPFERKYMTRLLPFYTWFRGMLPAVVESIALHPARVNAFNKADYNLAVTNGLDPYSLSDPFPQDQLFPSFLTDQFAQGPVAKVAGSYFAVSPGFAIPDVLNSILGGSPNPVESAYRNTLGMLNPAIKAPIELTTMKNLSTGGDIHDVSDYLDSQIPNLGYVSNFTGFSPTGSVASLLQGKGLDQQYQVQQGNKTPAQYGVSALNWLTGLGLSNYSLPQYQTYAQLEKKYANKPEVQF